LGEACHPKVIGFFNCQLQPREVMPSTSAQIIVSLRQLLASTRIQKEIRRKFFPHLRQEPDDRDPFQLKNDVELTRGWLHATLDIRADLDNIQTTASGIPKPYDDIFCYIAYRDLRDRMKMYQELAEKLSSSAVHSVASAA
jgi:hypothetical protein